MSGIPVYTQSPINAASKPTGVTPQTAAPQTDPSSTTPNAFPSSTAASGYPPARPGASAPPAPTGSAASRYVPLEPTKTIPYKAEGPPAPQPGSVPTPKHVPPPPRAGEVYRPEQTSNPQQRFPPQMAIPPPSGAIGGQPPRASTSISNTASSSFPVQIPSSESGDTRRSLEHPPGYHQDVNASAQTSEQRRAVEASNASSLGAWRESAENVVGSESMWNTAKTWVQQTGEKLSEAEAEVWRRINKG